MINIGYVSLGISIVFVIIINILWKKERKYYEIIDNNLEREDIISKAKKIRISCYTLYILEIINNYIWLANS